MKRREFLKTGVALAAAADLAINKAHGFVPEHNWGKYDFGSGPPVTDRLHQMDPFRSIHLMQLFPATKW